jgi:hypothetical protein
VAPSFFRLRAAFRRDVSRAVLTPKTEGGYMGTPGRDRWLAKQ